MYRSGHESLDTTQGPDPIEDLEHDNLVRLSADLPEDFDFEKVLSAAKKNMKKRLTADRRSRDLLHKALCRCLKLVLAAKRFPDVEERIFSVCDDEKMTFRKSTHMANRIVRLFMTDDPARVSDYAKALRGAIVAGYSPGKLGKRLSDGDETIKSLGDRLNINREQRPATVKVTLAPAAVDRLQKVRSEKRMLGIIEFKPDERQLLITNVTTKVTKAVRLFETIDLE